MFIFPTRSGSVQCQIALKTQEMVPAFSEAANQLPSHLTGLHSHPLPHFSVLETKQCHFKSK